MTATTTVKLDIEARLDEDLRQPYAPTSDVSDWNTWELAAYLYLNGELIKTFTETVDADGGLVRTDEGEFYTWIKKAYLGSLELSDADHRYFLQTRRIDAGHNTVLHEGVLRVKGYSTDA